MSTSGRSGASGVSSESVRLSTSGRSGASGVSSESVRLSTPGRSGASGVSSESVRLSTAVVLAYGVCEVSCLVHGVLVPVDVHKSSQTQRDVWSCVVWY